ncbi:MAG: hypothetical protein HYY16_07025 [Planctomycetes bacterium]|nr:hypothetical protein [Planctomycetota bacterium]
MHRIFAGLAFWTAGALVAEFVLGLLVSQSVRAGHLESAQALFSWHMLLGVGIGTLVTVLHVMTMFHFIGSGREIKEHAEILGDNARIVREVRRFKALTFPFATFAPIVTGAAVILGGGAHMQALPAWVHWVVGLAALAFNGVAFPVEYRCLKLNLDLIHEVDERVRRDISPAMFRDSTS